MSRFDFVIVGGGVVGFATARELISQQPRARVLVLEKESAPAPHQTGRNSGVIHSGIYYTPGSFKARFARQGADSMTRFCREQGLPVDICGKLIVATRAEELPRLEALLERARLNQIPVRRLTREQAREIEPHVACIAAIHVLSTGITSYRAVTERCAELFRAAGGEIKYRNRLLGVRPENSGHVLLTDAGEYHARFLVNCAGLHSDRVARLAGVQPPCRIVPFRGEYYDLAPSAAARLRSLIYPLPDPRFPFLGVHLTRSVDGGAHAGPNAVLALAREGYSWGDIHPRDLAEMLGNPSLLRLLWRCRDEALKEALRSLSKTLFTRSVQRLMPDIRETDLTPAPSGVRAQALGTDGRLIDDFLFERRDNALHVLNAPSPAATASLEIAKEVVSRLPTATC